MNKKFAQIKICITDDHQLFAEGVSAMLSTEMDMSISGIAKNKSELMQMLGQTEIDIILLDIKLPDGNGTDLIPEIKKVDSSKKIIVISTYSDVHTINKCIKQGADAFLIKNCNKKTLCDTIRDVNKGKQYFQESMSSEYSKSDFQHFSILYKITKREFQIMELIKQGKSNNQISEELSISIYTTETHRKNIMQKLGLKTPSSLLLFLVQEM